MRQNYRGTPLPTAAGAAAILGYVTVTAGAGLIEALGWSDDPVGGISRSLVLPVVLGFGPSKRMFSSRASASASFKTGAAQVEIAKSAGFATGGRANWRVPWRISWMRFVCRNTAS